MKTFATRRLRPRQLTWLLLGAAAVQAAFLLCATARAEDEHPKLSLIGRFQLLCPVCRQEFASLTCTQSNTRGGIDRDLFARALGPQPEFYRISTCPNCGYSGYGGDFDPATPMPPDFLEKVQKSPRLPLPPGFKPASDPRELDASVRYALAITCYEWRQKSDEAMAWLHLRSSWVAREEGSSLPPDPRLARVLKYVERWRPPLAPDGNQLDVEMQLATRIGEALAAGEFNRYQRPYVELTLALILRRHGENAQAAPLIDALAGNETFTPVLHDAIGRMRASIELERRHQVRAADLFERAVLSEQIVGGNRAPALYLLGELNRRLGRDAQAATWFERATAAGLNAELAAWSREQRALCRP